MHRKLGHKMAVTCVISAMTASAAVADLHVTFVEGAPKDRFEIQNTGPCSIAGSTLLLDLSDSQGALIFDVSATGAGVEVFQPFELVAGSEALKTVPVVVDGQSVLDLRIGELPPGAEIAFTIDVDDTMGGREITVSGAEIQGAVITLRSDTQETSGVFSSSAKARVQIEQC
ncbi:MAG: aggregation factor core [Pseudomonadota bacterium]